MEGKNKEYPAAALLFAALVPHRDALSLMEKYRQKLFALGFEGAFSLPAFIPLACLAAPLSFEALKAAALVLRREIKRFTAESWGLFPLPESPWTVYGPVFTLPELFPSRGGAAACSPAGPGYGGTSAALTAALLFEGGTSGLPPPPELSFTAAALTNLEIRPAGYGAASGADCGERPFSFYWRTGPLFWLPKTARSGTA